MITDKLDVYMYGFGRYLGGRSRIITLKLSRLEGGGGASIKIRWSRSLYYPPPHLYCYIRQTARPHHRDCIL